ncbi:hypothetical protein [Micromonospora sp. CA-246542]|uniref:hypothetical protein n=1 Tax=Micromonospora sp. CA-246542 TaxID=3239959 RepID=UPI003D919726
MRFETDAEFHFDFFLAEQLKKTVAEIQRMSSREYMQWSIYFGRKAQQRQLANR